MADPNNHGDMPNRYPSPGGGGNPYYQHQPQHQHQPDQPRPMSHSHSHDPPPTSDQHLQEQLERDIGHPNAQQSPDHQQQQQQQQQQHQHQQQQQQHHHHHHQPQRVADDDDSQMRQDLTNMMQYAQPNNAPPPYPPPSMHMQPPPNPDQGHLPLGSVAYAQATGSPDAAPPNPLKQKERTKVSRACDECRRKKIRCDAVDETGATPCSNCARTGAAAPSAASP
ncbi:putative transcriptional regulatory protein [Teratosphaeria destructans]|uniref:Transcriptional regulatory protein n=1 Tax=Teratosphaeria destructans TaxID=418781 RepID=A0A9W7T076_9PEZI|nr:putative transcriptional regulatory protein [Teratosphaeria destructans]